MLFLKQIRSNNILDGIDEVLFLIWALILDRGGSLGTPNMVLCQPVGLQQALSLQLSHFGRFWDVWKWQCFLLIRRNFLLVMTLNQNHWASTSRHPASNQHHPGRKTLIFLLKNVYFYVKNCTISGYVTVPAQWLQFQGQIFLPKSPIVSVGVCSREVATKSICGVHHEAHWFIEGNEAWILKLFFLLP